MTTSHPRAHLSAYLDDALAPSARMAVEAHVAGCPDCQARLGELRATARLIGSLPDLVPARRLTPRIVPVPMWLAPMRTLATLASGISVFLFMASAILANIGWLSQGAATDSVTTGAAAVPPAVAPAASGAGRTETRDNSAAASNAAAPSNAAAKQAGSPSPSTAFSASSAAPEGTIVGLGGAPVNVDSTARANTRIQIGPSPWLWLVLAIVLGAVAIALQRRLRSI